jgi:hypothetical protein
MTKEQVRVSMFAGVNYWARGRRIPKARRIRIARTMADLAVAHFRTAGKSTRVSDRQKAAMVDFLYLFTAVIAEGVK